MVWEGIEDVSPLPTRVWLSRAKGEEEEGKLDSVNTEEWKPLRKVKIIVPQNLCVCVCVCQVTIDSTLLLFISFSNFFSDRFI